MTAKQMFYASMVIGQWVWHSNGECGKVIGVVLGKKARGLWLQVSDLEGKVWCQYSRCK